MLGHVTPGARDASSPPVYPPREDSELLVRFAKLPGAARILEVGCGSGVASLAAARTGARVVATDLNPGALRRLALRAASERLRVEVVRTDLAAGLGRFDRILANPPYLPTPGGSEDPDRWHHLALDGGPDGLATARRLVQGLGPHLAPGGSAFIVFSSLQDPAGVRQLRREWRAAGGRWVRVARRRLEGETLSVERLDRAAGGPRARRAARRSAGGRPGTARRRRTPPRSRSGSSPGPGRGRTRARDAASIRTRSPRGS